MSTAAQIIANQTNAQASTGPKTEAGKAASSKNSFRHGLSGEFVLQPWETAEHYDDLLDGLRDEHEPATPTEALLVEKMAQHWWLGQRALNLQELTFSRQTPLCDDEKALALYLRYQSTHDRAFHKCLGDLTKLRAARQKEQKNQQAQELKQAEEERKHELHHAKLHAINMKIVAEELKIKAQISKQPLVLGAVNSSPNASPLPVHKTQTSPVPSKAAA